MRNATLILVALTAVTAPLGSDSRKPAPADVGPGRVAWFDISSSDLAKSKEFYARLFDWKFAPVQGTDQAVDIVARGVAIGTLRSADGKVSPSNGVVYVQVNDVQESCSKAKQHGGTVVEGFPFNLSDRPGAIGVVLDPAGHPIGMYSRKALPATP